MSGTLNTDDNLNPHAEARLAMSMLWKEYCVQRGDSMVFWNSLCPARQRVLAGIVDEILHAAATGGRATLSQDSV